MNYLKVFKRIFLPRAFLSVFLLLFSVPVFAQSPVIFWGKIINEKNEFATTAEFDLKLYSQDDSSGILQLQSFGCGFNDELGIFWLSSENLVLQDTLTLEIENSISHCKFTSYLIINNNESRIINLGEFHLTADSSLEYIYIGENSILGDPNIPTVVDGDFVQSDDSPNLKIQQLGNPYPNPFIASHHDYLTIPIYSIAKFELRVYIYDIRGRLIWMDESNHLGKSSVLANWDGRDFANRSVTTGTYVVLAVSGSQREQKLISLVK
ncbi:MAG: hypothetical protein DWQ05_18430 [Calditrichaeota bacterium]|nr:MAG: hypothetical protein DWQ05_18430 [Calditrichota bacterium]